MNEQFRSSVSLWDLMLTFGAWARTASSACTWMIRRMLWLLWDQPLWNVNWETYELFEGFYDRLVGASTADEHGLLYIFEFLRLSAVKKAFASLGLGFSGERERKRENTLLDHQARFHLVFDVKEPLTLLLTWQPLYPLLRSIDSEIQMETPS